SVYLEAGREQGVTSGDSAEARRDGRRIAGLIVREVTSRRALCDTFAVVATPAIGDDVHYTARPLPEAVPAGTDTTVTDTGVAPARPISSRTARRAWRGRIGAGFLSVNPEHGSSISQPTLNFRLDRRGAAIDFHGDVRGRTTGTSNATEREARVYRMAATIHDALSRRRVTFGRQVLTSAPGAAFFDGVVAEIDRGAWTFGAFGGGAPEPSDFTPSFSQIQAGGFARVRRSRDRRSWSATMGLLDARYKGVIDRNALFLDVSHSAPGRALFAAEEMDLNPSWKRNLGDPAVSATSTFFYGRQSFGKGVSLDAGFDNRRSVRLARDRESAETVFDDRYRRGGSTGLTWEPKRWLRVGGSGRWSAGLPHATRSFTGTLFVGRPKALDVALRLRATRIEGESDGWLRVAEGEWSWGPSGRVLLRGGWEHWNDANGLTETGDRWQGLELERSLGTRVYGFASGERRDGDGGRVTQSQLGISYFF
ncbi:MAG: hypothetical protein AAB011_11240, partial [Candidatus Eisenbacteria bacterium]